MNTQLSTPKNHVIRYQNLPVLTTVQLANFFFVEANNIQQNFKRNTDRFIEGKHYFKLEASDLKEFKQLTDSKSVSRNTRSLILWTERGAARHAKMLDTDHAWDVFEQLEDSYFKQDENKPVHQEDNYRFSGNGLYLPKGFVSKYFVESKADGTMVVRPADQYTLIRRTALDVVKKDCQTIMQELKLFAEQIEKMENSLELDADLLPILGRLNWRGI